MIKDLERLRDSLKTNGKATRENIATALTFISKVGTNRENQIRELLEGILTPENIEKVINDLDSYDI